MKIVTDLADMARPWRRSPLLGFQHRKLDLVLDPWLWPIVDPRANVRATWGDLRQLV